MIGHCHAGSSFELTARPVHVYGIDVLRYEYPHLHLEIRCGKGTYIRSLARDLGQRLGSGGLIASLRRCRVGTFTPEQGVPLEASAEEARRRLMPLAVAVAHLPEVVVDAAQFQRLRQGQAIPWQGADAEEAAIFHGDRSLAGIGRSEGGKLWPSRVLAT